MKLRFHGLCLQLRPASSVPDPSPAPSLPGLCRLRTEIGPPSPASRLDLAGGGRKDGSRRNVCRCLGRVASVRGARPRAERNWVGSQGGPRGVRSRPSLNCGGALSEIPPDPCHSPVPVIGALSAPGGCAGGLSFPRQASDGPGSRGSRRTAGLRPGKARPGAALEFPGTALSACERGPLRRGREPGALGRPAGTGFSRACRTSVRSFGIRAGWGRGRLRLPAPGAAFPPERTESRANDGHGGRLGRGCGPGARCRGKTDWGASRSPSSPPRPAAAAALPAGPSRPAKRRLSPPLGSSRRARRKGGADCAWRQGNIEKGGPGARGSGWRQAGGLCRFPPPNASRRQSAAVQREAGTGT
jgi:hypothetical protein